MGGSGLPLGGTGWTGQDGGLLPPDGNGLPSRDMGDVITVIKSQTLSGIVPDNGGLAVEVVEAIYPHWAVNGHDLPAAFKVVAEGHTDPAIRHTAATTELVPLVTVALERAYWPRARAERQAQGR